MAGSGRHKADARLIAALAAGKTARDAARTVGIGERTVYRRLRDPAFRQDMDAARHELVSQAVGGLSAASMEAVDALRDLLKSELDFARLGAARSILELGIRLREHADLAERVAELEAAARRDDKQEGGWDR